MWGASLTFCCIILFPCTWRFTSACPPLCSCKWKNGKQTVSCPDRNLSAIPDGLDPGTQVLDFTGNSLKTLPNELFAGKQLTNLQRIYLSRCRIRIINAKTFKGLTNLVELDLSGNALESVPTSSFVDCPSLMRLTLSLNPIKVLKKFAFNHLSFLGTLELSRCEIGEIEEGAFRGLYSLEWLMLDDNKLRSVGGKGTLPETLKGVELGGNFWECDCHIRDLSVWLSTFDIPVAVQPTCASPPRLAGRVIKSIPVPELACLPDVSPTTFYLELAEGKNVSLLCHVHSVPEAAVSWHFQGHVLQNNSAVAPGLHLVYFLEEGAENKRSELFVRNANSEDNGTFVCSAENAAGLSQANFTIRIIIKEDPVVIVVALPVEYLLAGLIGVGVLGLVITAVVVVSIFRCRRRRSKRNKTKEVSLRWRQDAGDKCAVEEIAAAEDAALKVVDEEPADDLFAGVATPIAAANQASPTSLRRYQLEQNPDLINGTEGCRRIKGRDAQDGGRELGAAENERASPIGRHLAYLGDVRWNVGWNLVDAEGYPLDYGLPKPHKTSQPNDNYYRTLPCNRMRRQSVGSLRPRYSQEAEFLSSYDCYPADVRYTADGYPAAPGSRPNEGAAPASMPCCSVQWPRCVPANLHTAPVCENLVMGAVVAMRCVSAQTDNPHPPSSGEVNEILTESPDEGYEGEPAVV